MALNRLLSALFLAMTPTCLLYLSAPCLAQQSEPNMDEAGCPNLTLFPKLVTSVVVSCRRGDSVAVTMPLPPDAQGYPREKSVRGIYEFREYQITQAASPRGMATPGSSSMSAAIFTTLASYARKKSLGPPSRTPREFPKKCKTVPISVFMEFDLLPTTRPSTRKTQRSSRMY